MASTCDPQIGHFSTFAQSLQRDVGFARNGLAVRRVYWFQVDMLIGWITRTGCLIIQLVTHYSCCHSVRVPTANQPPERIELHYPQNNVSRYEPDRPPIPKHPHGQIRFSGWIQRPIINCPEAVGYPQQLSRSSPESTATGKPNGICKLIGFHGWPSIASLIPHFVPVKDFECFRRHPARPP